MRRALLSGILLLLAGFAAFQVARRLGRRDESSGARDANSELATRVARPSELSVGEPTRAQGDAATKQVAPPVIGSPQDAVAGGAASSATKPSATDATMSVSAAVAQAADAAARGDLPGQARALTLALDGSTRGQAPGGWAAVSAILPKLREVNEQLWFNASGEFRSAKQQPGPLARVAATLAKQTPPVRVGVGLLARMNEIRDLNKVPGHRQLRVPIDSMRMVVRRNSMTLTLYLGDFALDVFPVGIGKTSTPTPVGEFKLVEVQHLDAMKREATVWVRPDDGARFYYGDAGFPFGKRFLRFAAPFEHYGIHGTDRDDAIGAAVSHGCVRLRNEDVEAVADLIDPMGAPQISVSIE